MDMQGQWILGPCEMDWVYRDGVLSGLGDEMGVDAGERCAFYDTRGRQILQTQDLCLPCLLYTSDVYKRQVLYSASYPLVTPFIGSMLGLKAFVAAVLGGIGNIPGAMLGGYLIGVAESLTKAYISTQLSDAVVFGILIVVLLVKPSGLLGKNVTEKV